MRRETAIFLEVKQHDINDVKYIKWQWDISYLVGITNHLHVLNAEQQGTEKWVLSWSDNKKVFSDKRLDLRDSNKNKNLVYSEISSCLICASEV